MPASAAGLRARLTAPLAEVGLDLEDVHLQRAGRRELVRIVIDRDGGIDLDVIAEASQLISSLMDAEPLASEFTGSYVLEVTSPGVDRPLTEPRHWRRAVGRLVSATLADGAAVDGRIVSADDASVVIRVDEGGPARAQEPSPQDVSFGYDQLASGSVQVEFSRADGD